ncbi:transmembrane protease serine 9-like [Euwallacea fornicatus]|uniref:transmembrane protease serine 9-like n=1 Tax=Euwallacea fornicatus TaxID=995702 RepID=UPI00338F1B28
MKVAVFVLGCFLSAFVSAEIAEQLEYDWSNIKPLNIEVKPIGPPVSDGTVKIVGGTVATRNQFPYQAALVINNSGFCGGSIISNRWILTAAHCVDTSTTVSVILGAHNPMTTINEPTQVRLAADSRIIHQQWNRATLSNDIALLSVNNIPNNTAISAITLASASSGTFVGSNAIVSGWGRTSDSSNAISSELRFVQVPVITNAVCQRSYGSIIQSQHICTSGSSGRGSCNGDSGGPLVVNGVEIGIVSFGASQCQAGHPSAFARVSHFRDWIQVNSGSTKMKIAIFVVVCLLSSSVSADFSQEFEYDWNNLKPINVFVEPIGSPPADHGLRIVGGEVAQRNSFPYQVALIINNSGFCGGSIISNSWVLTAAHCISSTSSVQVIAGAHNPSTTVNETNQVRINAKFNIIHDDYDSRALLNDIALSRVDIPIENKGISAIKLAPANSGNFVGSSAVLTGWGRTSDSSNVIASELHTIQLPIITNAVCQNSFGNYVQDQHICTSGAGNRGACNGDSGGPLVVEGYEVGIVSFGSRSCEAGHPTVYARVSAFSEWIAKKTSK